MTLWCIGTKLIWNFHFHFLYKSTNFLGGKVIKITYTYEDFKDHEIGYDGNECVLLKKLFTYMKIPRVLFVDICVLVIQWLKCSYLEGIFDLFDWVLSLHTWLDMDSMSLQMIRNTLQVSTG